MGNIEDRDYGYNQLTRALISLAGDVGVYVGVRAATAGADQVTIAAVQEFGSADGHVPERSYLRSTVDKNRRKYGDQLAKVVDRSLKAKDAKRALHQGLGRVGVGAVGDVQRKMTELRQPPNAPSTIAQKGTDNPLIDTGRLRQSIDYLIEEG